MASGSWAVLFKNISNAPSGLIAMGTGAASAFHTWKTIRDRQWNYGPQTVKDQAEAWYEGYWKRHLCQDKNMWVDRELGTKGGVTAAQLGELIHYKMDLWRIMHASFFGVLCGGWAVPWLTLWWGTDSYTPSTFNRSPAEYRAWRDAQDMLRYKYAPAAVTDHRWFFEFHVFLPEKYHHAWAELQEKNNVHRDPHLVAYSGAIFKRYQGFRYIRRKQARAMARAMGIPTFPMWGKICTQARLKDYWEIIWNEDFIVMSQQLLPQMSEASRFDYAWRRFLSPGDVSLSEEQVTQRIRDYHIVLGGDHFLQTGQPNCIFTIICYCLGHYHEPGYLQMDISELEQNDFEHLSSWGKDAFLRRLEFENGPLRDQVEAHSVKRIEGRKEALDKVKV